MTRLPTFALVALTLSACGQTDQPSKTDDTAASSPEVVDGAPALGVTVDETGPSVEGLEAALLAGGSLGRILAVDEVAASLDGDAVLAPSVPPPAPPMDMTCTTVSRTGSSGLALDFAACSDLTGTATVTRLESRFWIVTFDPGFSYQGKAVTGSLALDGREAELTGLFFHAYSADAAAAASAPLALQSGTTTSSVVLDARVEVDTDLSQMSLTGTGSVATTGGGKDLDIALLLGDDGSGTGSSPLVWNLGQSCLCPSAGTLLATLDYAITAVELDLDDYVDVGDGQDDYAPMTVDLRSPVAVSTTVAASFNGTCGDLDTSVSAEVTTLTLDIDDVLAMVEESCGGTRACDLLLSSMESAFSDGFDVDVTNLAQQAVSDWVDANVDGSLCLKA